MNFIIGTVMNICNEIQGEVMNVNLSDWRDPAFGFSGENNSDHSWYLIINRLISTVSYNVTHNNTNIRHYVER